MDRRIRNLDQVKELVRVETRIDEVIEGYGIKVTPAGSELKALCPFHQDTDPSLGISVTKQLYLCRACQEAGDVFRFVMLMDDISFVGALRKLARDAGVDLSQYEDDPTEEEQERSRLVMANRWVEAQCAGSTSKILARWIAGRKLDGDVLSAYGVGFATRVPDGHGLDRETAERLCFDPKSNRGWWNSRVVVPLKNEFGETMGFRTRSVDGSVPKTLGPRENHPLPVPVLYGLHEARKAIREAGYAILVEGEIDVWQMCAFGHRNVVATLGTHFNEEQARILVDRGVRRVVVLPDADEAGRKYARKVSKFRFPGLDIQIGSLTEGDPDEALLRDPGEVVEALANARHVLEYSIVSVLEQQDLSTVTAKMEVLHEMIEILGEVPELEREIAYQHLAEALGMGVSSVQDYYRSAATSDRLHNVHGEKVALARALQDGDFLGELLLTLKDGDLFLNRHRVIFNAMQNIYRDSQPVTLDTVALWLENRNAKTEAAYVRSLGLQPGEAGEFVLADIRDKSARRALQVISQQMSVQITDTGQDTQGLLSGFSSKLASVVVGNGGALLTSEQLVDRQMERMHRMMKSPNLIIGLDFGPDWFVLNHALHGLQDGNYFVLAAPSGVGKTAMGVNWLKQFAVNLGEPCLYLTFETGAEQINYRLIGSVAGVEVEKITTGFLTEDEVECVHEAATIVAAAPIIITSRGREITECMNLIRHDILRRGTKVVFIDYVQLMSLANAGSMNRYNELGKISAGLSQLCDELGIAIVALAQINREGSKKGRSTKLDIGDCYIIAQDAVTFFTMDEKSDEEIEEEGIERGNRTGLIDKYRWGRDRIRMDIMADLDRMIIKEVRNHRTGGQNGTNLRDGRTGER